jgi:MFS family permease
VNAADNRFGPFWLQPGVTAPHMLTLFAGALTTIGLLTFIAIGTPMVLTESLGLPSDRHGTISGALHTYQEVIAILVFGPLGVLADRIGRRAVYVTGLVCMGIGYALYSYATSLPELFAYRFIYALGIAAATAMLGTVVADYTQPRSRGLGVASTGVLNAIGVILVAAVIGQRLPEYFAANGATQLEASHYTHLVIAGICVTMALVMALGLKGGTPVAKSERPAVRELMRSGFAEAAANPRIALAYACAFIARSDLVLLGTYLTLWGYNTALEAGTTATAATAAGSGIFRIASTAALAWLVVIGLTIDRFNRVTSVIIAMSIAAAGYLGTMFVDDPLARDALPFIVLLGIGQISAFAGAQTLIAKEATDATRGSVIGMFNAFGAIGIFVSTFVGGILFDRVGPHAPFVFIGALTLGLIAAAVYVRRRAP